MLEITLPPQLGVQLDLPDLPVPAAVVTADCQLQREDQKKENIC